ncbi:MAG: tetratricopeptide repeat protein [Cyanobacteria bacterium P01_A01_bin.83]
MSKLESPYLKLIDTLLNNPREEEINILNAHSELVNQELISCLMSVGEQCRRSGNIQSAERLIDLASKLLQLENTNASTTNRRQEYFSFLMDLLQQISNRVPPAQIYALIRQNQDKLNLNATKILHSWAHQTIVSVESNQAKAIANDLINFGNLIGAYPAGDRSNNIELAIVSYKAALKVYQPTTYPKDWAMVQSNLANSYRDRVLGSRHENIEQAIATYSLALEVITREKYPYIWGNTQRNLGIAYGNRIPAPQKEDPSAERAKFVEQAIACYNRALAVHTLEQYPQDWAACHNNLGDIYPNRLVGDKADNIETAIEHLEKALTIYTLASNPNRWAMLQNNLGNAFQTRLLGERENNIERAISHYQNALSIHTLEKYPYNWAMLNNNLGGAYRHRVRGDKAENHQQAIAFLNKALLIYSQENFPRQWAEIQHNLKNINNS